jgi:biopolymer transport protein ExbB
MIEIFQKGGPVMWPLLILSMITLAVVLERMMFVIIEKVKRNRNAVQKILEFVERGDSASAIQVASGTRDVVARILLDGLVSRPESLVNSVLSASNRELKRFSRGLAVLDTAITLAPLLGLLGTVTGLIRSFYFLGSQEVTAASAAITGGIAEALYATAFGLSIAICALVPFNYLNSILEENRHEIEDAGSRLELLMTNDKAK